MKPVSVRACYHGVAETSVDVDPTVSGRGLGRRLLDHQMAAALASGCWTLQTSPEYRA